MKLRYEVPEVVWNSYKVEVEGIEFELLNERLKWQPNIWMVQDDLPKEGIQMSIELNESCFEFIETYHEQGDLSE